MLKVGITGGIGSGKSTVAKVFESLGIAVYYADAAAKRLMNEDETVKQALTALFGEETYIGGELNRPHLSSLVFNNPEKLALLNAAVHPATIKDAAGWMLQQKTHYAIKEAALIFESGSQDQLDVVIGVSAPEPLRILRVMKRDHINREAVKARMENQLEESLKMRLCDYVITNDEQQLVIPQVLKLHEKFLAM